MSKCKHERCAYWPSVNEDGWKCIDCFDKLGYRPDLDVLHLHEKVASLLHALHDATLVYVSNGSMGEIIADKVVAKCEELQLYDQHTIVKAILADSDFEGHADYWRKQAMRKGLKAVPK